MWRRLFGLIALAALVFVSSCDKAKKEKPPDLKVTDWLEVCSPFESLDGARMLLFEIKDHSVKLSEAVGEERTEGALMAKAPKVWEGTWSADEVAKTVLVDVGSTKATYTLVIPYSEEECILAAGATTSASLRDSWFGSPSFGPDESDRNQYP